MRHNSQIKRFAAALWAAIVAVWMPGLFDGYGAPRSRPSSPRASA